MKTLVSMTGAFEEKNNVTASSVFRLVDVVAGLKVVSEWTSEVKYYYLTKVYCPKDQNSLFRKQFIQGGESKDLNHEQKFLLTRGHPWMSLFHYLKIVFYCSTRRNQ